MNLVRGDEPDPAVAPDDRHAADIAALHAVAGFPTDQPEDHLTVLLEAGCGMLDADAGLLLVGLGPSFHVRVTGGPRAADAPAAGETVEDARVLAVIERGLTVASLGGPGSSAHGDLGPGVLVASPVTVGGRIAGAVTFTAGQASPFTARQLALVDLVADGASRILERQADQEERHRLETCAQAAIDLIPDPVVRVRRDGQILDEEGGVPLGSFDPCASLPPVWGGPAEERAVVVETDPAVSDLVQATIAAVLAGRELRTEVFTAGPGLTARRVEARFVPAAPDEVLCIVRDITERHRAEVALGEQLAFEALATSVSTELIGCPSEDLDGCIERGLGTIARFFSADAAHIYEIGVDGSSLRVSHQWTGSGAPALERGDQVDVAGIESMAAQFELTGHIFDRGRASQHPEAAWEPLTDAEDRGVLWVRLGYGGELVGVLGLTWRRHDPPASDEAVGLVRFAADAFLGAIRRRSVSLLADGQAEVFELIARGAPLHTALSAARTLLERHVLGAEVVVAAVDDAGRLDLLVGPHDQAWAGWFAEVEPTLTSPFGQAVASGEPVMVADLNGDLRFPAGSLPEPRHRSASLFPVRSPRSGRTLAVVGLLGTEPGAPQPRPEVRASVLSLVTVAVEREYDERRLAHQATHDPLTGVSNRASLMDRLDLALARCRRSGRTVGVLFCDLDEFKAVNDRYGHDRGDRLLVEVARRIVAAVRPSDTVCRLGGDEFVVVCDDLDDAAQVEVIAGRVRLAIQERPVDVGEAALDMAASVGVAVAQPSIDDAERLLRRADLAMYEVKQHRRAPPHDASAPAPAAAPPASTVAGATLVDLVAHELDDAIDLDELRLAMQPLVGRDGSLVGVEVFLRWDHPERGELSADRVLAAAGVDPSRHLRLGRWVRRAALASRGRWINAFGLDVAVPVHVNVSGVELLAPGLLAGVLDDLDHAGVSPESLVLEVREADLAGGEARAAVSALAAAGTRVLVDGAGEGGIGLSALADLEITGLKVGPVSVARIHEEDPLGVEVVRSLVLLAHGLGWESYAVGVESEHQRAVLFGFGVHSVQGRAVAMPVTADGLRAWLAGRSV